MALPTADLVRDTLATRSLLLADRTYNTSHPDYDATKVRNYPGRIFNHAVASDNVVYEALRALARGAAEVEDAAWGAVLGATLAEAGRVEGAQQVFERWETIRATADELGRRHGALYNPGWVNVDDALFLYWVVRTRRPRTIVQSGVSNGLSTAFMILALAQNGQEATLHAVDLPQVFDPRDPAWTRRGEVYGVMIPEGKSSGWMVPDRHRSRLALRIGDARQRLPELLEELDGVDLFFHDSDHTYEHIRFELATVHRKLRPGGVVLCDDISWCAALWDFADEHGVPAYNFKGSVGAAFF